MDWIVYCLLLWPAPEHHPACSPPALFSRQGMGKVSGLAKGFALSCLVHKGMTQGELRQILGEPSFMACEGGSVMEAYDVYGIQVFWSNFFKASRQHQPEKVQEVRYVWECWLEWAK